LGNGGSSELISDTLASVYTFSSTLRRVLEEDLLRQTTKGRLAFAQLKLLKLVAHAGSHTISDVAAFLGVSNTAASKAVDKLVRRRLIRRAEGQLDRRESELTLTGEGRRLLGLYEAARNQKLAELFGYCPPEQLSAAAELLDRLSAGLLNRAAEARLLCLQCGIYYRENCPLRDPERRACFYQKPKPRRGAEPAARTAATENGIQPPPH
jgi:DNA-binding MarR family transcriptional regulator